MKTKITFVIVVFIILSLVYYLVYYNSKKNNNMIYGTSFSPEYSQYLGYDYKKVYDHTINEMGFKYIRLMAQWDEIEKNKGVYDFTVLDYLMNESAKKDVKVMLAVGRKTPRWPECHLPDWAKEKKYDEYKSDLLKYIEKVVERYKDHKALEIWQVENEPFLRFGNCNPLPEQDLHNEITLVRKIDNNKHQIIVTDSGELSSWRKTAKAADLFGTTLYRVVWDKKFGYFSYDWLPPVFYQAKLKIFNRDKLQSFVVELQAEPWMPNTNVHNTSIKEQFKSMDLNRLKKNVDFASRTGMERSYLWGVEWWYYMDKKHDHKEFIEYVKTLKMK